MTIARAMEPIDVIEHPALANQVEGPAAAQDAAALEIAGAAQGLEQHRAQVHLPVQDAELAKTLDMLLPPDWQGQAGPGTSNVLEHCEAHPQYMDDCAACCRFVQSLGSYAVPVLSRTPFGGCTQNGWQTLPANQLPVQALLALAGTEESLTPGYGFTLPSTMSTAPTLPSPADTVGSTDRLVT